eukprot:1062532-Ditylum_brightwellii.AAC.1
MPFSAQQKQIGQVQIKIHKNDAAMCPHAKPNQKSGSISSITPTATPRQSAHLQSPPSILTSLK